MKKRILAAFLSMVMAASVCGGCAQPSTPSQSDGGASSPDSTEESSSGETAGNGDAIPIKFAVWGEVAIDAFNQLQDDFNAQNNGYRLEIDMNPNYFEFLNAKMASNDLPDIFDNHPGTKTWSMAREGMLLDLSDQPFVSQLDEEVKKTISYEGKVYAFPMAVCYSGIYYNKKIFEEAGITEVPKTLSEFKEACEKIKAIGVTPVAVSHRDGWTIGQEFYSILSVAMGDEMNDFVTRMNEGSTSFGDLTNWNNALDLVDMLAVDYVNTNPMDSDYSNMTARFANGEAAMYSHGCWSVIDITKINPDIEFGVFPFPVSEDPDDAKLMREVEFVQSSPSYTKVKEGVMKFYEFLADPEHGLSNVAELQGRIPAISYPVAEDKLSNTYSEAMEYIEQGKTESWVFYQVPFGMDEATHPIMQEYVNGQISREELQQKLDDEWRKRSGF